MLLPLIEPLPFPELGATIFPWQHGGGGVALLQRPNTSFISSSCNPQQSRDAGDEGIFYSRCIRNHSLWHFRATVEKHGDDFEDETKSFQSQSFLDYCLCRRNGNDELPRTNWFVPCMREEIWSPMLEKSGRGHHRSQSNLETAYSKKTPTRVGVKHWFQNLSTKRQEFDFRDLDLACLTMWPWHPQNVEDLSTAKRNYVKLFKKPFKLMWIILLNFQSSSRLEVCSTRHV